MKTPISSLFTKYNNTTPGCAVGVIRGGACVDEYYVGLANMRRNIAISSSTSFRLASLTKPFTAMAIMILQGQKTLTYEDTINRFFRGFPSYGKSITIAQLLSHTSGLPDHEKTLYRDISDSDRPNMYDALCVLLRTKKPYFSPGTKYLYSDSAYVILALIIERVTGMTYEKFLQQAIFRPLGMNATRVRSSDTSRIRDRAIGYKRIKSNYEEYDWDPLNYIVGDEGIYSTIPDLAKWTTAWETDQLTSWSNISRATRAYRYPNGTRGRCGYAWFIDAKKRMRFQDGIWVGFTNIMLTDLSKQTTVIVLSNTRDFFNEYLRVAIAIRILEKL